MENILDHFPDNPMQDPLGRYWIHMTNNYSVFQIATFGSLLMHEVLLVIAQFHQMISKSNFLSQIAIEK